MDNKYKGKMIAVVYLEKVVCEAHDINSAFSVRKFTSKLPQNNEQERGERENGGMYECRTSDQMGTREPLWNVRTTIDLYFTCSPEVSHT